MEEAETLAEEIRSGAVSHAAALLRQVQDLEQQLSQARREAEAMPRALLGGTSTASFAELAGGTGGFATSRILGRGGFCPVYRGEWAGQAVAIKRLDHVRPPPASFYAL